MKPARSKQSSPAPRGSRERREKGEVKNYREERREEGGEWFGAAAAAHAVQRW